MDIEGELRKHFGQVGQRLTVIDASKDVYFFSSDSDGMSGSERAWSKAEFVRFYDQGIELVTAIPRLYAAQNDDGLWYTTKDDSVAGRELLLEAGRLDFKHIENMGARSNDYSYPWITVTCDDKGAYPFQGNHYYVERGGQLIKLTPDNTEPADPTFQKWPPSR